MKKIKQLIIITITSFLLMIVADYSFGEKILNFLNLNKDESFRIPNNYYNHGFKKNYSTDNAFWGPHKYKFCSNFLGLRNGCDKEKILKYDYAFIGDSQTEGVGLNFEDTYVGVFAERKRVKVINLGIIQSSPTIYLDRLIYFLNNNLKFKELFIMIDLSDLHDEIKYNKKIFLNDISNKCHKLSKIQSKSKVNSLKVNHNIKSFVRDNFKVSYFSAHIIWWKLNFKKYFGSYTYDYMEKNFYRSAWTYNDEIVNYGGSDCMKYLISSIEDKVNEIYMLLKKENIDLSIIVAPWPGSIMHDTKNSKHVKIWKNFCETKCKNFVNLYPYFFNYTENYGKLDTINKHFFRYDVHYNKFANKIIADHIIVSTNKDLKK